MRRAMLLLALSVALRGQTVNPQQEFQQAVSAQQRGDFAAAERLYRNLLQSHPEAQPVRVNLAAVLAAQKQYGEVVKLLSPVLAAHPSDEHVALFVADADSHLGHFAEAVSVLLPAEAAHRDNPDIGWLLGTALINSGRPLDGLSRVERLAARGNIDACLLAAETRLQVGQYDDALKQADAALKANPNAPHAHTLRGMILEHSGDYQASVHELEMGLQEDSNDDDAHVYLGAILLYRRNLPQAREHLEKAIQINGSSPLAQYELALVKLAQGEEEAALKELLDVEQRNPQWLQPHVRLAALYYKLKRPEEGLRERKLVDQLDPTPKRASQPFNAPVP